MFLGIADIQRNPAGAPAHRSPAPSTTPVGSAGKSTPAVGAPFDALGLWRWPQQDNDRHPHRLHEETCAVLTALVFAVLAGMFLAHRMGGIGL